MLDSHHSQPAVDLRVGDRARGEVCLPLTCMRRTLSARDVLPQTIDNYTSLSFLCDHEEGLYSNTTVVLVYEHMVGAIIRRRVTHTTKKGRRRKQVSLVPTYFIGSHVTPSP